VNSTNTIAERYRLPCTKVRADAGAAGAGSGASTKARDDDEHQARALEEREEILP